MKWTSTTVHEYTNRAVELTHNKSPIIVKQILLHFRFELKHGFIFTNISLSSILRNIYKQCRTRSDTAEGGVWSGSSLFTDGMYFKDLDEIVNYYPQPFHSKLISPNEKGRNSIRHNGLIFRGIGSHYLILVLIMLSGRLLNSACSIIFNA